MCIAVDGRAFSQPGAGVGRYVFELSRAVDALLPEATFFVYTPVRLDRSRVPERWVIRVDNQTLLARNSFVWLKTRAARLAADDGADAFWGNATFLPRLPPQIKSISNVYDLTSRVAPGTMRTPS